MHARSQRAEPARSAGGVLAKPTRSAGGTSWFALAPRWHQRGALVQRCAHCAPHSSTWGSSDLKDGCPLETCSSQDRDSLLPRVGLRSDAVMSNLLSSPQTPGGTAVSCYATSLPLPPSPSSSRPFPVRASVTSKKKTGREALHVLYYWGSKGCEVLSGFGRRYSVVSSISCAMKTSSGEQNGRGILGQNRTLILARSRLH